MTHWLCTVSKKSVCHKKKCNGRQKISEKLCYFALFFPRRWTITNYCSVFSELLSIPKAPKWLNGFQLLQGRFPMAFGGMKMWKWVALILIFRPVFTKTLELCPLCSELLDSSQSPTMTHWVCISSEYVQRRFVKAFCQKKVREELWRTLKSCDLLPNFRQNFGPLSCMFLALERHQKLPNDSMGPY